MSKDKITTEKETDIETMLLDATEKAIYKILKGQLMEQLNSTTKKTEEED